jgi:hypothetical protein
VKRFGIALAAMATFALPGSAHAANFMVHYVSNGAAPLAADLTVTTSDVLNAVGGYDVLGIAGDVSGDTITGLTVNPDQPNSHYSADGWFIYDNVYFPSLPSVSYWGLLFTSATHEYNLFSDNATQYQLYQATPGVGFTQNSVGSLLSTPVTLVDLASQASAQAAVPEPTSWLTMAVGFGLLGGFMRSNRKAARQIA